MEHPKSPKNFLEMERLFLNASLLMYERNGYYSLMSKPWTIAIMDSDFSNNLQNIRDEHSIPTTQMSYGAAILHMNNMGLFIQLILWTYFSDRLSSGHRQSTGGVLCD